MFAYSKQRRSGCVLKCGKKKPMDEQVTFLLYNRCMMDLLEGKFPCFFVARLFVFQSQSLGDGTR
eukprot:c45351_g1_i1 orf=31-225(+)